MNKIRNLKYIVPFAMSAMVACNSDEPIPTPEPPKPVIPTAISIHTTADMTANMNIAAQNKSKEYTAAVKNNLDITTASLPTVGDWIKMDSAQTNLETDWGNFGIFFRTAEMLGYQLWSDNGSLDIKPNPNNGAIPMVSESDYAKFAAAGETDVTQIKEQARVFELTTDQAKNFNLALKNLVAQNPNRILNVATPDVHISNDSIYNFLRSLHVDNRSAMINIVDANKTPTDLGIAKTQMNDWDLGSNMMLFYFASPVETQLWKEFERTPKIILPATEKNMLTLDLASGKKDIAIADIDSNRLPPANLPIYSTDGAGLSAQCNFEWDAQKYGIYVSGGLSAQIGMVADTDIIARSANEAKVIKHLFDRNGIIVTNKFTNEQDVLGLELHGRVVPFWDPPMWNARARNRFAGKERYASNAWIHPNKRPGLPPPVNDNGVITRSR